MGFYRYIDYAIKCFIRKIIYSDWFWKILFLIVMVSICFSFCVNSFAAEGVEVPIIQLNGLAYGSNSSPGTIVSNSAMKGYYFQITEGYTYTVDYNISGGTSRMMLTKELPSVGVTYYDLFYNFPDGYTFYANYDGYAYVCTTVSFTVTATKFLDGYDISGINLQYSGSRSFGQSSTVESSSSISMYYAYLENGVEYFLDIENSGSSTASFSTAFSNTIPYIGSKYDISRLYNVSANSTYTTDFVGQGCYLLVAIPTSSSLDFPILYTYEKLENTTITDVNNSLTDIDNSLTDIDSSINQSTQEITNSVNSSTQEITNSVDNLDNTISSTEYDESTINIDTSVTDDIDDSSSTGLFTAVFDNLSNLISSSNWSSVETIDIGLPYTDSKIQLRSDLLSRIVGNSLLATLINVAWYSLFGLYVFRFSTNIFHAIKSGDILNGLNLDNEVISSTML